MTPPRQGSAAPLNRPRMVSSGVMTKAPGRTSTYGFSRDVQVYHFVVKRFMKLVYGLPDQHSQQ